MRFFLQLDITFESAFMEASNMTNRMRKIFVMV